MLYSFHSILDKFQQNFAAFITHVASIWCIWIIKDESLHFFQILYALRKMIYFNDGMLWKWNLRILKSTKRSWEWNFSMMESWKNEIWGFWNPLYSSLKFSMCFWKWYVSMIECWDNEIWGFQNPLCASENDICFNDGSWKNEIWGFSNYLCASLKSSMRFWKWYVSMMEVVKMKSEAFKILYALL